MRKTVITLMVVLGLALLLVGISASVFPEWLNLPGGLLILFGAAFLVVAALGGYLKDWRDLLFGKDKTSRRSLKTSPVQKRSQEMVRSEEGEQEMHGQGAIQNQKMEDSPLGKQHMD